MKTYYQLHEKILKANTAELISRTQEAEVQQTKKSISIYFLNNYTIHPIEPYLKLYLYDSGIKPLITFGNYDNVKQEILDDTSALYQQDYDIIVCSLLYFPTDAVYLTSLNQRDAFIEDIQSTFDLLRKRTNSLILINSLIPPFYSEYGIAPTNNNSYHEAIAEINQFICTYVHQNSGRFFLMDWHRYIQLLGEQESIDYRYWYMYKTPFKKAFYSYYASDITRVARALHGLAKKCLILDCDNTLWGGIIGEDGLSGIKLDRHDYPGKIFYDFQKTILDLERRGVILTLCSKNNEQDVWEVFEKHPHSLLRREHFAATRINWQNKADNIIDLAQQLNIGLDSCVFIDDSDTECEWVKTSLPELTVLQVPTLLYQYPSLLLKEGLFDTLNINDSDRVRNRQYQEETQRKEIMKNSNSINDYLESLQLVATIHPVKQNEIARVAQLTQKTNQFNLSTKRYTQQQIENFHNADDSAVYTLSVRDKFGDYGLTGVLIAKQSNDSGWIDTFLMSCRILSRHLEFIFLEYCLTTLGKQWNIQLWKAEYIKTEKNMQIQDFLKKSGFHTIDEKNYILDLNQWNGLSTNHIQLISEELAYE